jgi:hypothetical protein
LYLALQNAVNQLEETTTQRNNIINVPIAAFNTSDVISDLIERVENMSGPATPVEIPADFGCNVCFNAYNDGGRIPLTMTCGHILCLACMRRLPVMKCPSCRENINTIIRLHI